MFHKILIANRGEIACRIAATARRLGIRTVAVYSDADAQSRHVQACDEAVHLGPAPARESYLRADLIVQAAVRTGAQAIHPGYGFLSENADFARACAAAGLVFVGPTPEALAAMGSKSAAKTLMEAAGVPLVPGYHGDRQEADFLQAQAARIGYPVLIKASAGGGGKGMRIVQRPEDFEAALASCQREALGSFGDDRVLVERYLARPRHIEVQVFADTHGHTVHLFERDCSVQRRHQKVLEEAPAPGMSEACRQAMTDAAIAAARSVGYVGAGTVEFIAEHDVAHSGRFYFMEMNTRLQVEHPVTEAITRLDLVEWQLRVAAGEPLPLTQAQLQIHGHAIEARLCAENPAQQFLPATGRLQVLRTPAASAFEVSEVRIDSGVREGDEISPHYDSMIAKLIVHGADRAQALARLDAALAELHISGLQTNVAFVRRLARTRAFREADLDTALIEREHEALFGPATHDQPAPPWWPVAAAVSRWLHDEAHADAAPTDPWAATDGWRLQGPGAQGRRWLDLLIDTPEAPVPQRLEALIEHRGEAASPCLHLAGEHRPFSAQARGHDRFDLTLGDARQAVAVYPLNPGSRDAAWDVFIDGQRTRLRLADPLASEADDHDSGARLCTQMPGRVLAVLVQAGQTIQRGDPLVVTEAMKMEHTISAPRDGVVTELLCQVGDQVAEGTELLRLSEPLV